jgi:DNA-directed RNA polymerase subunit RPC12/RpoP
MYTCTDCGRTTEKRLDGDLLCEECERKRNESQDERRHQGDERHGK